MKTITSCLFILISFMLLFSCSNDSEAPSDGSLSKVSPDIDSISLAANTANPYDGAGTVHTVLFESYYVSGSKPKTLAGIVSKVEALADTTTVFKGIRTATYQPVSLGTVQYILDHPTSCSDDVLLGSPLSTDAKLSFTNFINAFLPTFETESSGTVVCAFVISYEASVLNSTTFTSLDKQLILTSTSILRHTAYLAKKKPKKNTDPDWTVLVGHIVGAVDGARNGLAESVLEALVLGIAQN